MRGLLELEFDVDDVPDSRIDPGNWRNTRHLGSSLANHIAGKSNASCGWLCAVARDSGPTRSRNSDLKKSFRLRLLLSLFPSSSDRTKAHPQHRLVQSAGAYVVWIHLVSMGVRRRTDPSLISVSSSFRLVAVSKKRSTFPGADSVFVT